MLIQVKKTTFTRHPLLTAMILASMLSGCGGTGQDDGSTNIARENITYSGVALDGYLARSTVYIDSNNNAARDPWEAFAFTDNNGYYSYNPITDTHYCASTATAEQNQYCLIQPKVEGVSIIRVDGGYDVLTGEPFLGQLSRQIHISEATESVEAVISPLTSLLTHINTSNERSSLLANLNINESDLDVDYLNTDGLGTIDTGLLNVSLKVHKSVTVLADRLTDTYTEIGDVAGIPADATASIYPSLAQQVITTPSLDDVLSNPVNLTQILDEAEESLKAIYNRKELDLPTDMGSVDTPGQFSRIIDVAVQIPNIVDLLIPDNNVNSRLSGSAKALELVIVKTVNELNVDSSIQNTIDFYTNNGTTNAFNTLLTQLDNNNASINPLINFGFTEGQIDSEKITTEINKGIASSPFSDVVGQTIKLSDLDLGSEPNNLRDIEAEFYFDGEAGDESGAFKLCIKVIEDVSRGSLTVGSTNTRGIITDGFWSKLGTNEAGDTNTLLLTLTVLGSTYQSIIKNANNQIRTHPVTGEEIDYVVVRADQDGDISEQFSELGFVTTLSIPTTDKECEERLPSRIDF